MTYIDGNPAICFVEFEMVGKRSLMWFRKGLRIHDNPALASACEGASAVHPVFVLDPFFLAPDPTAPSPGSKTVGVNRIKFLLESLSDLDKNLQLRGSRLLLLHGDPVVIIPELLEKVGLCGLSLLVCPNYLNLVFVA